MNCNPLEIFKIHNLAYSDVYYKIIRGLAVVSEKVWYKKQ